MELRINLHAKSAGLLSKNENGAFSLSPADNSDLIAALFNFDARTIKRPASGTWGFEIGVIITGTRFPCRPRQNRDCFRFHKKKKNLLQIRIAVGKKTRVDGWALSPRRFNCDVRTFGSPVSRWNRSVNHRASAVEGGQMWIFVLSGEFTCDRDFPRESDPGATGKGAGEK